MANTTETSKKKKSSDAKPKATNTKKTKKAAVVTEAATPVIPAHEKCGVYWCRFFSGSCCLFQEGDSMKKIVCIKDEGEKFFKTPRPKSRFAVD